MAKNPTQSPEGESPFELARLLRLNQCLADFDRDASAAYEAKQTGQPRGPQSGFEALDRALGHAFAPGLHPIHGNAGAGKTAFALQVAARCGFPALFVSCEMAPSELLRRHTARETKTYLGRFKTGEFTPEAARALALRAIEASPLLAILDATQAPATPNHIRHCALAIKGEAKSVLVVIDSLQSWTDYLPTDEYESINTGIKDLRDLALGMNIPILFTSERNRDSMKSGGLNAGAGSRKIEYGAETLFDLERDSETLQDGAGEVGITLKIAKNRHGAAGVEIPLKFNGALQSFRELDSMEATERASQKVTTTQRGRR
ncbi:hypothetical protein EON83_27810 [bacterium]|nr:MAG: hypothetical protein EON83_27810 [bacterium]